ncbi:ribosomal protein L13e-domain-containing protein [Schizothecium vesticola]|uniref:60S ribosomal protein L13 n=1 Tax=Schizothecium vesticola TaxID=314040 RepID=A0AA40EPC6_9PEZI|nr:ribosomal protein L13e-domain-containing protein [Schizothecium vesticola]
MMKRTPCDIVLVIDVSGSMDEQAPVPHEPGETVEDNGLSVLDLTKHAAKTILETLDGNDRLGIVSFSMQAKVVQPLTTMTRAAKRATSKRIEEMKSEDATNLWAGILSGIKLFEDVNDDLKGNMPALMVLTDGMPNHMCPAQGYVPKLRSMGKLPATIHTFGFGYQLRSGLLKSIAEVGGGNYSFIPDAGMIGTVFIHAVANLQSTFANNTTLTLTYPASLGLEETTGESVEQQPPILLPSPDQTMQLTLPLSTLQYGQSRDIYLRFTTPPTETLPPPNITASLTYHLFNPTPHHTTTTTLSPPLPPATTAFHTSRSLLLAFLSTVCPLRPLDLEHIHVPLITDTSAFLASFPAAAFPADPACLALTQDLAGQVSLALASPDYYHRWGKHFLPSLGGAHARQVCNSFKDPGPMVYGGSGGVFERCRGDLDRAFDGLAAPVPSRKRKGKGVGKGGHGKVVMSAYNRSSNPCFAGCGRVEVEGGGLVRIGRLRRGVQVVTPRGVRRVVAVLRTVVRREGMCLVGGAVVTPWHPVRVEGEWVFPVDVKRREVRYTGAVYSVLLERDEDADAHAICVDGVWGVTLGHGRTGADGRVGDVRTHGFLGDYDRVVKSLGVLHRSRNFRKDWQRRVRCHFDQAGKKASRRVARRAKAAAVAPRPVDKLRPVVRCPTIKYNRRTRLGRGFSLAELKAAGIPKQYAPTIGISVDPRRANLSEEGLAANVERLKAYKARLILFPKKSNKPKKTDTPKDQQSAETTQSTRAAFQLVDNIAAGFREIKKSELPKSTGSYKALRKARSDGKLVGVREKRAKDKADAEAAAKK